MKAAILLGLLMLLPLRGDVQGVDAARELYERGKFQGAADLLSSLIRQSPKDVDLRILYGKTCLKLRRWDLAVQEFDRAVELDPQKGQNHLWLARAYGNKAQHSWLSAIPSAGKARKEFETAAQLSPANVDIRFDLLEFYAQAPGFLGGGREKAAAQAEAIARLSPRLGYTARAEIYQNDKEWDRARQELIQATLKFPNDAGGHADLAGFLLQRRDYEGAEASAQKALALDGSLRGARLILAAAQVALHRNVPGALQVLQELAAGPLTENDPSFEEVNYWLGQAYLAQGQKAEARQAFQISLGFDPDYSRSKDALAQIR